MSGAGCVGRGGQQLIGGAEAGLGRRLQDDSRRDTGHKLQKAQSQEQSGCVCSGHVSHQQQARLAPHKTNLIIEAIM